MNMGRIVTLLLGTGMMLLLFGAVPLRPALGQARERETKTLSYYLMDTTFLEQCARRHRNALEKMDLFPPQLRVAVLQPAQAGRP
jgi:hypothetical protein